jgi:hypothetical protein
MRVFKYEHLTHGNQVKYSVHHKEIAESNNLV